MQFSAMCRINQALTSVKNKSIKNNNTTTNGNL